MVSKHLRTLYLLIMSTPHAQERLEDIFEEVKVAFPYYDEDKQIEIANKRFEDELI